MNGINKLKEKIGKSAFSKQYYEVTTPLDFLKGTLLRYNLPATERKTLRLSEELQTMQTEDFFKKIVPEFQRENTKWDQQMKIKFVENIICGMGTTFILGYIDIEKNRTIHNCVLIDGLQRVTALLDFFDGKFPIFEDIYYSKEMENHLCSLSNANTRIYSFENNKDMVQFYIDMNENITHSNEDIEKAKNYLRNIKG